jgi:glutamate formiminotransferase
VLIECVPNVSDGRRAAVVDAMAAAVAGVPGVLLLDVSSDAAHDRSVFTFAGPPHALEAAALLLAAHAVEAIDLRNQHGVHPRVGALDVVPFVPLAGAGMPDCVGLARRAGAAIADRFAVPVFLYEEAATHPARRRLEAIRRGGLAALAARMREPGWAPDFGPPAPHPSAGVCVVGARRFLIAFNMNLTTDRVAVAARIAAAIRESSGGLPGIKAIGVPLVDRRCAQVSVNVTDFERTPLATVFEAVVREAARDGADVAESEIVGLVPRAALAGTSPEALRLRRFTGDRVLETRLAAARPAPR